MKYRGPYKPEHNRLNTEALLEEREKKSKIKWPEFKFGPLNLWVMPPTKEAFNIIMEHLMSGGIESMFEEDGWNESTTTIPKVRTSRVDDPRQTSRMDVIGQNGNDGLHYSHLQIDKEKEHLTKLIEDHWNYINDVLINAGCDTDRRAEIGFHYRTAFAHGFKHHKEYVQEENK